MQRQPFEVKSVILTILQYSSKSSSNQELLGMVTEAITATGTANSADGFTRVMIQRNMRTDMSSNVNDNE